MKRKRVVNIGDTDENADWILSKAKRKEEVAICDKVTASFKKKRKKKSS